MASAPLTRIPVGPGTMRSWDAVASLWVVLLAQTTLTMGPSAQWTTQTSCARTTTVSAPATTAVSTVAPHSSTMTGASGTPRASKKMTFGWRTCRSERGLHWGNAEGCSYNACDCAGYRLATDLKNLGE